MGHEDVHNINIVAKFELHVVNYKEILIGEVS